VTGQKGHGVIEYKYQSVKTPDSEQKFYFFQPPRLYEQSRLIMGIGGLG